MYEKNIINITHKPENSDRAFMMLSSHHILCAKLLHHITNERNEKYYASITNLSKQQLYYNINAEF
jgi:hypothetical protein